MRTGIVAVCGEEVGGRWGRGVVAQVSRQGGPCTVALSAAAKEPNSAQRGPDGAVPFEKLAAPVRVPEADMGDD